AEVGEWTFPDGTPNYGALTEASYGGRVGIWRLLDILDRHNIKATFNTCGLTVERYPESARAIVERGHEIAGHTYDHRSAWKLSLAEETEDVRKTVAAIKNVTGEQILGWRDPTVQPSTNTLKILADEGFVWDGNFLNYDLPYMLDIGDKSLVEIPYTFSTDDWPFIYGGDFPRLNQSMVDLHQVLLDEFNVLYAESEKSPKMFAFQSHPELTGRAHRAIYFDRFLTHLQTFPDVWFAQCSEMAKFWLEHHNTKP
ncbi:polysaccharide deacetylase family protein, partial [Chloroflexota bacterium]